VCAVQPLVFKSKATDLIEGEEQLEKQKRQAQTLIGAEEEEKIFKQLQNSMKSLGIKNTIVINGWKDNGINKTVKREYDFLIICEPLRAIFHIESKTGFSTNNFGNAAKQLKSGLDFFCKKLPFPESEKWNYIRVASFANMKEKMFNLTEEVTNAEQEKQNMTEQISNLTNTTEGKTNTTQKKANTTEEMLSTTEEKMTNTTADMSSTPEVVPKMLPNILSVCSKCQKYVVGSNWNFSTWWKDISKLFSTQTKPESTETYSDIVKFLLHQMLMQNDCITESNISSCTQEKIEMITTMENIFFWNNVQFSLLTDSAKRRVVFASPFGTGKTSCIRAKVEQLLNHEQKVVIVVFQDWGTSSDSLLKKTYEIHFRNEAGQQRQGITIESIQGTCNFDYQIVRMRESYQGIVNPWIRFAYPWIRIDLWSQILTPKRFDLCLTIRIRIRFVLWVTNP
jgi:hypothetical protein